jgi:hypothetical protein
MRTALSISILIWSGLLLAAYEAPQMSCIDDVHCPAYIDTAAWGSETWHASSSGLNVVPYLWNKVSGMLWKKENQTALTTAEHCSKKFPKGIEIAGDTKRRFEDAEMLPPGGRFGDIVDKCLASPSASSYDKAELKSTLWGGLSYRYKKFSVARLASMQAYRDSNKYFEEDPLEGVGCNHLLTDDEFHYCHELKQCQSKGPEQEKEELFQSIYKNIKSKMALEAQNKVLEKLILERINSAKLLRQRRFTIEERKRLEQLKQEIDTFKDIKEKNQKIIDFQKELIPEMKGDIFQRHYDEIEAEIRKEKKASLDACAKKALGLKKREFVWGPLRKEKELSKESMIYRRIKAVTESQLESNRDFLKKKIDDLDEGLSCMYEGQNCDNLQYHLNENVPELGLDYRKGKFSGRSSKKSIGLNYNGVEPNAFDSARRYQCMIKRNDYSSAVNMNVLLGVSGTAGIFFGPIAFGSVTSRLLASRSLANKLRAGVLGIFAAAQLTFFAAQGSQTYYSCRVAAKASHSYGDFRPKDYLCRSNYREQMETKMKACYKDALLWGATTILTVFGEPILATTSALGQTVKHGTPFVKAYKDGYNQMIKLSKTDETIKLTTYFKNLTMQQGFFGASFAMRNGDTILATLNSGQQLDEIIEGIQGDPKISEDEKRRKIRLYRALYVQMACGEE